MPPCALICSISGVVNSSLMTIGGQVSPRARMMNAVCVPLPAPGAPPSRMISFGKRRCSRPTSSSSAFQIGAKMTRTSLTSRSTRFGLGGSLRCVVIELQTLTG
jgi:hypothetical protein